MDIIKTNQQQGFTLIELIIVIMVISILASYAVMKHPGTTINLGAEAKQLASDIRYTQTLAMTKGERYYLQRNSAVSYQILSASGTPVTMPNGATLVTLYSGTSFGSFTNLPSNLIAFNGEGSPYTTSTSPGTALASTATIPITNGTATLTVSITPQTGRVTVS